MSNKTIQHIAKRILLLITLILLSACLDLYDPKRDIKPVRIQNVEHIINGKRYSIRLYHSAPSLATSFFNLEAVDSDNVIHYATGTKAHAKPDSARVSFLNDGMVEIIQYRKSLIDTLKFKPMWHPAGEWK